MVNIIVTGYPYLSNAIEAVKIGADGYVTKPIVNTDEFLMQIKEHLKRQEESKHYTERKVLQSPSTHASGNIKLKIDDLPANPLIHR